MEARVLSLLVSIVPFHFLFHFEVLVGECLTHLLCLESQHALKRVLLGAEHLHLPLVEVELLSQLADHLLHA